MGGNSGVYRRHEWEPPHSNKSTKTRYEEKERNCKMDFVRATKKFFSQFAIYEAFLYTAINFSLQGTKRFFVLLFSL